MMIDVQVTNPEEIRLRITVELSIGQWEEILERSKDITYYAPLREMLGGIRRGIDAIKARAHIDQRAEAKP
jgi:hypothetical protein